MKSGASLLVGNHRRRAVAVKKKDGNEREGGGDLCRRVSRFRRSSSSSPSARIRKSGVGEGGPERVGDPKGEGSGERQAKIGAEKKNT